MSRQHEFARSKTARIFLSTLIVNTDMAEEKSSHDLKEESCVENATAAGDLEGNKVNHTLNATTDEDSKDYVTTKTWIVIVVSIFHL